MMQQDPSPNPSVSQPQQQPARPAPSQGKYDKSVLYTADHESEGYNCIELLAIGLSYFFTILLCPCTIWGSYKVVRDYERAVIFRMGRIKDGPQGPGSFFVLQCTDDFHVLDLRTVTFDVPKQEVLTADSVTVQVDAVVYYRVFDPVVAVCNVVNYNASTNLLASSILRNVLGTKTLTEILADRENLSTSMSHVLDEATDPWGVKVERIEIKDVRLPNQFQRAMAAEAEAHREAKAKIVAAEGEAHASTALKEASAILSKSPGALQLRYLQTLNTIAAERQSTILFPLPLEMLAAFGR